MVNTNVRKNDHCVIGLPSCGYVFSSTKSCFIGYGFRESAFEKDILSTLLQERGVEPVEAGGNFQPGKYAFCHKICSKIITAQFCIVILNNDIEKLHDGRQIEKPNANVNMEFGLILGHNKYVIPFQRDDQVLPFNVSGLDTVKYNSQNFKAKASVAIGQAISETNPGGLETMPPGQAVETFLLARGYLFASLDSQGDKEIFRLGGPLGFNLVYSFDGLNYVFFGNFTQLDSPAVIWRLTKLEEIVAARFGSASGRKQVGVPWAPQQEAVIEHLKKSLKILVLLNSAAQKDAIQAWMCQRKTTIAIEAITPPQMQAEIQSKVIS